jgi:alanine racemase
LERIIYNLEQIAGLVNGELFLRLPEKQEVIHLVTDSRKITAPDTSLFFAISGDRRNGHEFIQALVVSGVTSFVISQKEMLLRHQDVNFILVADPLRAMQQLAAHHRQHFTIPVLGITGSNGKTIVKEWLYQLLREDYHIVRSPKSYNSQIGVPLSVWQMSPDDTLAIFEAGISMPGEMANLEKIIRPDIGIFTNIGQAHDENFLSQKQKIAEKLRLFTGAAMLLYCRDYLGITEGINEASFLPPGLRYFTWSRKLKADLQIGRVSKGSSETEIQAVYRNDFISIRIPFTDEASVENAIHCWAMMLHLGYDQEIIGRRMEMLSPVAMRLEMKEGINNTSIINDSYNSDIGSLTIALDFLNQQKQYERRTVILSDILQSGKSEESLYKEVNDLLLRKGVRKLIGIGPAISRQQESFSMEKYFYTTTDDFLREYNTSRFQEETVLLKGARPFGFERISRNLQQKAHETVLEINLNAVVHNLNYYRSRLAPQAKIMAMVKAFSYGSGSFEIANIMQFHQVDYLAVAYADEGVELRKTGITLPIMVMNPEEQSFEAMIAYKLEPEIYSFRILKSFSEALKRNPPADGQPFPIHIKLDTGMHRLGFEEEDVSQLIVRIKNNRLLRIVSIFSHLAGSDEQVHDGFTREQIEKFNLMSAQVTEHFKHKILKHILNSAGIIRFPEAIFDMVRLGIGLHGIAAGPQEQRQMQTVATLKTTISQLKNIKAGESIGYSRKAYAERDMVIGTVGIGYADGLNRKLGNGNGKMLVNGAFAPIIGNICMDMAMLDLTDIPAKEGNEVLVFGNEYSIIEMAKALDTIPYEILTNVSQRVKRVYFHE